MPKIVLVAVNAKFIHANAAIYSLKRYCEERTPFKITPLEFTVNDSFDFILSEIYESAPDILGFSCYIWNIGMIKSLVSAVKKINPKIKIILGGPEVSFDASQLLAECPADIIVEGEGEETLREILSQTDLNEVKGITFKDGGGHVITNPPRKKLSLSDIPFPYVNHVTPSAEYRTPYVPNLPANKIIYYESSRGCPSSCGYCLSHNEKPVRFLPLERVFDDLDFFIGQRVTQVKFTDRTFNYDKKRAFKIWEYLIANDNGYTNFHFEVSSDMLEDDAFGLFRQAPDGLFQFEIGIQSTHPETLRLINRQTQTESAIEKIKKLKSFENIHIHLDLIAGLPAEGYMRFAQSFNDVHALEPDMLQLGFLKLLKGSRLRSDADKYGIVYNESPPYEVLYTNHISYDELATLKSIEQMLDMLYNSGNFKTTLPYVQSFFDSPFRFYEAFAAYWKSRGLHRSSRSLAAVYEAFAVFAQPFGDTRVLANRLKYDWYMSGNQKSLPLPLCAELEEDPKVISELYKSTGASKRFPMKRFDGFLFGTLHTVYVLFEYIGKPRPGSQKKYVRTRQFIME
ncbi:MAG: B12-binding domain-containing radical SAM protein [Defluviitaleaceae bacterium]|nr:B12-binding domain-containing radical SAM protein [Defluviitaleaceae bacterium]